MSRRTTWVMVIVVLNAAASAVALGTHGQEPPNTKKWTAEAVAKMWSPSLKSATDYNQFGGSPKQSPNVAAYSFRVIWPTFEELWNHYAKLCGIKQRYAEKTFLVSANAGPKGCYVVSDYRAADGMGCRGLSLFLLKTETYTVTVTFHPDAGDKSISGSLSAVVP